jgi:hypothetical protein
VESGAAKEGFRSKEDVVVARPLGSCARIGLDNRGAVFGGIGHRRAYERNSDAAAPGRLSHGDARDHPHLLVVDRRCRTRCCHPRKLGSRRDGDPADRVLALEGQETRGNWTTGELGHGLAPALGRGSRARKATHL